MKRAPSPGALSQPTVSL
uniref:Uncharacterized protein n=1 Tax=Arundo donax TaxID=35708 RepID=A0A0A8YWW2_ARUDO